MDRWLNLIVVLDLKSPYVCIGRLTGESGDYYELADADLHDFRDTRATRETYVFEAARLGVRRNRARVWIRRDEVIAITGLDDIVED